MTGTIVNVAAVAVGSTVGMAVHSRLPKRLSEVVFQAIGLFTLAIGVKMSLECGNMIMAVLSLVLGSLVGESCRIEERLESFAARVRGMIAGKRGVGGNERFSEGFVTATMLYCVGSMAILGSIEDGMGQPPTLLLTKSLMDGISSVALAASFGAGVALSIVPMFVYQGSITALAVWFSRSMSEAMIADMTGVGGILLIGMGINILGIKKISVVNMLPALLLVVPLSYFFGSL